MVLVFQCLSNSKHIFQSLPWSPSKFNCLENIYHFLQLATLKQLQDLIYFSSLISDASVCTLLPVLSLSFHPGNGDQVRSHHSLHCAAHFAFQSTFILTISLDCVRQLRASMPSYSQGLACSVNYPGDGRASYSVLTASSISAHASVFTPFACIHSCKVG